MKATPEPKSDADIVRRALGNRIKAWRTTRGMLVRELAAKVGVGEVCQCKRESGRAGLRAEDIAAYEGALELPAGTLMAEASKAAAGVRRRDTLDARDARTTLKSKKGRRHAAD